MNKTKTTKAVKHSIEMQVGLTSQEVKYLQDDMRRQYVTVFAEHLKPLVMKQAKRDAAAFFKENKERLQKVAVEQAKKMVSKAFAEKIISKWFNVQITTNDDRQRW
jgi:hypothetical protein